jgi:Tol biopolymer transport system component
MSGISHKQAIQLIHRHMDGLLNESQRLLLEEHLRSCDSCRDYANNMDGLSAHLQNEFHHRWDARLGPSQKVSEQVMTKTRNIPMTNRISSSVKLLAGAIALILLGVIINFVISQLQSTSSVTNATKTVSAENRLLAFTSNQNGNLDIYTMRADGSGLTNLTNHPAKDLHPIWSPDGKHIAFESDRDGFMQIYRMDADGSNVVQITRDEADHKLTLQYDGKYNPWSPDGNRLIFIQEESAEETGTLYSIDINGENEVRLANGRISPNYVSWSPDGKYIGYVLNVSSTPNLYVADTRVVEPDGSNARELKKLLPAGEQLDSFTPYYWSSNGQSIVFPALTSDPSREAVYELDLQTNTFLNETETKPVIEDWSAEVSLILDINQDGMPFVWERSDGTSNTFEASRTWGELCDLDFTRSPQNNFAFGVYCPDNKFNLYWTNADGSTIKQLLTLPIDVVTGGVGDIAWSPDDQYIAFNITTANKTDMYVVKVEEMLVNPSLAPLKVSVNNESYSIPSWQPIADENITKEIPTPQPTSTSSPGRLIAFTSEQNSNLDIYTVHPDGSGLTNLTNNPAQDSSPFWSPDGKHIAFESARDGFTQIYLMDADGSNVIQITDDKIDHKFENSNPWSPNGDKLIFAETAPGDELWTLYIIGVDGQNKIKLAQINDIYGMPSWSPDGEHIAYIVPEPIGERNVDRIHVVDANGNHPANVTKLVPQDEDLNSWTIYWSLDGQSLFFVMGRYRWENGNSRYAVYEATLDGETLTEKAVSSSQINSWWDETSFIIESNASTLTWQRSDGTSNTFKPLENCQLADGAQYGFFAKPSSKGNQVISVDCPNGDLWFYYANPDGSVVKQLLSDPISDNENSLYDIVWSPDDQFILFNIVSSEKNTLYILNVSETLNDPSAQPAQITLDATSSLYTPSWQPIP